jgi:hypothetical protein
VEVEEVEVELTCIVKVGLGTGIVAHERLKFCTVVSYHDTVSAITAYLHFGT